jgi:BlaI family transcriptional regulator, penicillinase repressor
MATKTKSTTASLPRPTESEQEILFFLWQNEPTTVREIWEKMTAQRTDAPGYNGVLKLMTLMHEKGLVSRTEEGKAHLYRSARAPERMKRQLVGDLMDRMFDGSASALVIHALGGRKVSAAEAKEITKLLKAQQQS